MRRVHNEPFDNEADEADDLTTEFWGPSRGWTPRAVDASGQHELPGGRRATARNRRSQSASGLRAGRTGGIDRTRSHGIVRPGTDSDHTPAGRPEPYELHPSNGSQREAAKREATLGELAAGLPDDDWADFDLLPTRPQPRIERTARNQFPEDFDGVEVPLMRNTGQQARAPRPRPRDTGNGAGRAERSASRRGVDPLLARLGLIVLIGLLVVPIALATRGDKPPALMSGDLVATPLEGASDPGSGAEPVATDAATTAATPASTAAGQPASSAAAATAGAQPAAATARTESFSAPAATTDAADQPEDATTTTTTAVAAGSAVAAKQAVRVEPVCAMTYTVSFGDSWYRIADAADVGVAELTDANLATIEAPIYPGDEICLPAGATMPAPPTSSVAPTTTAAPVSTGAPATTAPPTTVATGGAANPAQVQQLIRDIWPDELEEKALQIAWRESNYVATAHNGSCCYGVFQIYFAAHKSWLDDYGILTANDLLDARKNITAAYTLYVRAGGWGPWGG